MANIFQKIFLKSSDIVEIDRRNEIANFVKATPVNHESFVTKTGMIVRKFSANTPDYNVSATRTFDPSRNEEQQIQYSLHVSELNKVKYATHSDFDKFAKHIYNTMYKIWDKSRQHAK